MSFVDEFIKLQEGSTMHESKYGLHAVYSYYWKKAEHTTLYLTILLDH